LRVLLIALLFEKLTSGASYVWN